MQCESEPGRHVYVARPRLRSAGHRTDGRRGSRRSRKKRSWRARHFPYILRRPGGDGGYWSIWKSKRGKAPRVCMLFVVSLVGGVTPLPWVTRGPIWVSAMAWPMAAWAQVGWWAARVHEAWARLRRPLLLAAGLVGLARWPCIMALESGTHNPPLPYPYRFYNRRCYIRNFD